MIAQLAARQEAWLWILAAMVLFVVVLCAGAAGVALIEWLQARRDERDQARSRALSALIDAFLCLDPRYPRTPRGGDQ